MNDGYLILRIDNMGNAAFAGGLTVGRCEYEPVEDEDEDEEADD